jgi:hypothetical protein
MGCGCKDPQEGLDIQAKPATLPSEAIDEFQSKINSLQSEKNIWKSSYEDLSTQVNAITSKLDALLDTLPENIQQQFNEAFSEAPMAVKTPSSNFVDKKFSFSVEIYLELPENFDECDVLENITIGLEGENFKMLQTRVGEAKLSETNNDAIRAEMAIKDKARLEELDLF